MLEAINAFDQMLVLGINGWNSPFMDEFMWIVSSKTAWIPLYLLLLGMAYKCFGLPKALLFTAVILMTIGTTDFICSGIFKPYFERMRPSHEPNLEGLLHYYQYADGGFYKGGRFGFISSHAGNFFALAVLCGLGFKKYYPKMIYVLLGIALLVSFSRMYLTAHYLTDLVVGGAVGGLVAYAFLTGFQKWVLKEKKAN